MKGYTLIEVSITIIILLIITTVVLAYNRNTELNVLVLTEQMKIKSFLNQAKNYALEKRNFNFNQSICGYGANFSLINNNLVKIILFADLANDCLITNNNYDSNDGVIKEYSLKQNLILKEENGNNLNNLTILFKGPYLVLYKDGSLLNSEYKFYLVNFKNQNRKGLIKIEPSGIISTLE